MTTLDIAKQFIEHAPAEPCPVNPDLAGWTGRGCDICAHCAGRIVARGCDLMTVAARPIWKPDEIKCQLCSGRA